MKEHLQIQKKISFPISCCCFFKFALANVYGNFNWSHSRWLHFPFVLNASPFKNEKCMIILGLKSSYNDLEIKGAYNLILSSPWFMSTLTITDQFFWLKPYNSFIQSHFQEFQAVLVHGVLLRRHWRSKIWDETNRLETNIPHKSWAGWWTAQVFCGYTQFIEELPEKWYWYITSK